MSVWQNFKNEDHTYEKKIISGIFLVLLCVLLFFMADKFLSINPTIKLFLSVNALGFKIFFFSAVSMTILFSIFYINSLDYWEAETASSKTVLILFMSLWAILWISWGIYCAWLTMNFNSSNSLIKLILLVLLIVPPLIAFLFSRRMRLQDLKQQDADKLIDKDADIDDEAFTKFISRKFYSGYYALLSLPVYLLSLLISYLI